jgi:hypothetical protein
MSAEISAHIIPHNGDLTLAKTGKKMADWDEREIFLSQNSGMSAQICAHIILHKNQLAYTKRDLFLLKADQKSNHNGW